MERSCDGCTACCKTHYVHELKKMGSEWCQHCEIGKGCKIYGSRPFECQHFRCLWIQGQGNPEHRPDRIRIVSEQKAISGIGIALFLFEVSHGALHSNLVRRWTLNNLLKGICVLHAPYIDTPKLYLSQKAKTRSSFAFGELRIETEVVAYPESVLSFA